MRESCKELWRESSRGRETAEKEADRVDETQWHSSNQVLFGRPYLLYYHFRMVVNSMVDSWILDWCFCHWYALRGSLWCVDINLKRTILYISVETFNGWGVFMVNCWISQLYRLLISAISYYVAIVRCWAVACDLLIVDYGSLIAINCVGDISWCKSWPPIRPVLKHGPRSLAYTQVIGL